MTEKGKMNSVQIFDKTYKLSRRFTSCKLIKKIKKEKYFMKHFSRFVGNAVC